MRGSGGDGGACAYVRVRPCECQVFICLFHVFVKNVHVCVEVRLRECKVTILSFLSIGSVYLCVRVCVCV